MKKIILALGIISILVSSLVAYHDEKDKALCLSILQDGEDWLNPTANRCLKEFPGTFSFDSTFPGSKEPWHRTTAEDMTNPTSINY